MVLLHVASVTRFSVARNCLVQERYESLCSRSRKSDPERSAGRPCHYHHGLLYPYPVRDALDLFVDRPEKKHSSTVSAAQGSKGTRYSTMRGD